MSPAVPTGYELTGDALPPGGEQFAISKKIWDARSNWKKEAQSGPIFGYPFHNTGFPSTDFRI